MKIFITIVAIAVLATVTYQCGSPVEPVNVTTWQRNLEDEKNQIILDLYSIDAAIERQLEDMNSKVVTADKNIKVSISKAEKRLLIEKENIKKELSDVRSSTENTWDGVKQDVKENITDIKIRVSRVREKMRNEIDRM